MKYDIDSEFFELQNDRIFYQLITGLSYRDIANKYYLRNKNKFIYKVRKLMSKYNIQNRRQLVFWAFNKELVNEDKIINL
ncbi:MAG: hypothetical protein BHW64_03185 [Candidatus Melainabacteria bacterium LEY3_CP_29_8]|nr:MAG: hypothetical protein BHW64_03185 [Candidatus Melainabacteria bacterium LEY3_CP_29_8]